MATIANLVVNVGANTAHLRRGLKGGAKDVGGFRNSITQATASIGGLQGMLGTLGMGLGVAALIGKFNSLRASIDASAKSARMLGMDMQDMRGLGFAADITGLGSDRLPAALKTMNKRLGEAARGSGAAIAALKELGLEAGDLVAMDPAEALAAIAERYAEIESPAKRAAIAANIFSKANLDIGLLLAEGGEGMKKLVEEYKRLHGGATEGAAGVEEFNDSMTRFKVWAGGRIEADVVAIAKAINLLTDAMAAMGADVGGEGIATDVVNFVAAGGLEHLGTVVDWINELTGARDDAAEAAKKHKEVTEEGVIALESEAEIAERLAKAHETRAAKLAKNRSAALDGIAAMKRGLEDQMATLGGTDPLDLQARDVLAKARPVTGLNQWHQLKSELGEVVDALKAARKEKEAFDKQLANAAALKQQGQALAESLRTPAEQYQAELADLRKLRKVGALDGVSYQRALDAAHGRLKGSIEAGMPQSRPATLIGSAAEGSSAAYDAMQRARFGGNTEADRQKKIQQSLESMVREAVKQTLLQEQIAKKKARIAQVPP